MIAKDGVIGDRNSDDDRRSACGQLMVGRKTAIALACVVQRLVIGTAGIELRSTQLACGVYDVGCNDGLNGLIGKVDNDCHQSRILFGPKLQRMMTIVPEHQDRF